MVSKSEGLCGLFSIVIAVVLQACASNPSRPPSADPGPVTATPSPTPDSSSADNVLPNIFRAGRLTYDLTISSIVQSVAGDSVPRTDTTTAAAIVAVTLTAGSDVQTIQAVIRIDSAHVSGQSALQRDTLGPYAISISPQRAVRVSKPTTRLCSLEQPQLLSGDEVLPALPIGSALPVEWVDTTRYDLCRGGISFRVTRIAQYRARTAVSARQSDSVMIIRSTQVSLEGRGTQWQQPVEATGRGASTDTLTIAHQRLVGINGITSVEITFRSQFRTQTFTQRSHTLLRARPSDQ